MWHREYYGNPFRRCDALAKFQRPVNAYIPNEGLNIRFSHLYAQIIFSKMLYKHVGYPNQIFGSFQETDFQIRAHMICS